MSSLRGTPTHTPRGGALTNGSLSKKVLTPSRTSNSGTTPVPSSRSISCTRVLKTTAGRPNRPTTAAAGISSPRKASAPGKLLSAIGGSLDSLPDTVTLRRKVSAPTRSGYHVISTSDHNSNIHTVQKPSVITRNKLKKSSAPAKLGSAGSSSCRMSKDHSGGSSGQQGAAGAKGTLSSNPSSGADAKAPKKGFTSYTIPEIEPLPTVKEEKKLKGKSRKMSEPAVAYRDTQPTSVAKNFSDENAIDVPPKKKVSLDYETLNSRPTETLATTKPKPQETLPTEPLKTSTPKSQLCETPSIIPHPSYPEGASGEPTKQHLHSSAGPGSEMPRIDAFPEKAKLEKMVSDLIKNNECKKQEIAALKMEINRLKETVRELHNSMETAKNEPLVRLVDRAPQAESMDVSCKPRDREVSKLENLIDSLSAENRCLRDHLQQLGISLDSSPLSDQQKELLLSRVTALSQSGGENASCGCEKDWDNKSSSSISEISVACLQGRIQQMEETHYSTNEELQATLQELDDLREQLSECQIEVQQLQEEKQVILESLTQQTEKLNEARSYNDTLKLMLIQQSENSQDVSQCERTQRLMELLKSVQEDKELVQLKQEELDQQLQASSEAEEHFHNEAQLIRDRMKLLESMVEAATNDKKNAENQLLEAQEKIKATEKETSRLKMSLGTAKEKITELEATVISGEKSELADVLERVCAEKETLEKEAATLQKRVNNLVCENEKLKEQVIALQDSLRVTRNNAKTNLDDVEWKRTQLDERRRELEQEIETLKTTIAEIQLTCQHHLEDKRELKASLSESQKKLAEMLERQSDIERGFSEERVVFTRQVEEWEQYQKDLLTSVRVANDFKTEAQHKLEKFQQENMMLKERLKQLDFDIDKAKVTTKLPSPANSLSSINSLTSTSSLSSSAGDRRLFRSVSHMTNGESILSDRRNSSRPLSRGDSRVKSLIESIECATKQTKAGSRSSSTSSLASNGSENNNNNVKSQILKRADTDALIRNLPASLSTISPLKESLNTSPSPLRAINCNSLMDSLSPLSKSSSNSVNLSDTVKMSQLSVDKNSSKYTTSGYSTTSVVGNVDTITKPMSILSNKIEPIRKNSYGQLALCDKKDPLASLAQSGGSKRNALLKWCQNKIVGYPNVDITNFSSSWNDGLAFCALLDSYLPEKINYRELNPNDKRKNFEIAFDSAESVGIPTMLDINDMIVSERPSWQLVFNYVTSIYAHFET